MAGHVEHWLASPLSVAVNGAPVIPGGGSKGPIYY